MQPPTPYMLELLPATTARPELLAVDQILVNLIPMQPPGGISAEEYPISSHGCAAKKQKH